MLVLPVIVARWNSTENVVSKNVKNFIAITKATISFKINVWIPDSHIFKITFQINELYKFDPRYRYIMNMNVKFSRTGL